MMKILAFVLITGLLSSSSYGFLSIDDFRELIEPKCYDYKDSKELINGQISPLPSSLETFVSIIETLEEKYTMDRILRGLIARYRYDDLLYRITPGTEEREFITRGEQKVKKVHEILQDLFGVTMNNELRDSDLTEDEQCALYFMISHTVNDTVLPNEKRETTTLGTESVLKFPREQGVVNLNTRTRHAFALGKVLLGILAGLQDSEKTISAESIFKRHAPLRSVPENLKDVQINVLHGVTISDVLAIMWQNVREKGRNGDIVLPNGYWDDSVCPTQYILDDNNGYYATKALIRGAVDGLILGKKLKQLRDSYADIRLSQVLRIYYSPGMTASDASMSEISWCNRHSLFTSYQNAITDQATAYFQLYAALLELTVQDTLKSQMSDIVNRIASDASTIFDEPFNEAEEGCRAVSSGSKVCETPRDVSAILDFKASELNREMQYQIIGNLSVGLFMGREGSSMSVYSNLRPVGGGFKLHTINSSEVSGCASCAAKYYGFFDVVPTNVESEVEVFRDLNRTLTPDDLSDDSESEAGVPSKVVLYFNYGAPSDNRDLRNAVSDFRYQHRGTRVFAIGSKKESLRPFVEDVDYDILTGNDARALLTPLKERVCKIPAQFQYKNCYRNSRSDEDTNIYHGFITPYHVQYWAMYPKYFLKSYHIEMTFTPMSGLLKICYTRNYDDIYGTRQVIMNCQNAETDKPAIFKERDPCKKRKVHNCNPFYFTIEALNAPVKKCSDKKCRTPNQIEFEFKHSGISCNRGISFAATPMTLVVALFISMSFAFKLW